MRSSEDRIGLKSGWFFTVIPYSVSMPMTFGIAMCSSQVLPLRSDGHTDTTDKNPRPLSRSGGKLGGRPVPPIHHRYWPGFEIFLTVACFFFRFAIHRLTL